MSKTIYQLKITLKDSKPPIWRRIVVPSKINLYELHHVIQRVMDWEGFHLYDFIPNPSGPPLPDEIGNQDNPDIAIANMKRVTLDRCLTAPKQRMFYWYDFGDDWMHDVLLEKILPFNSEEKYPRCLKGKGACPPEDCGGIWGYYRLLEALRDPDHPEHEELLDWVGTEFDPNDFNVDVANAHLNSLKLQI